MTIRNRSLLPALLAASAVLVGSPAGADQPMAMDDHDMAAHHAHHHHDMKDMMDSGRPQELARSTASYQVPDLAFRDADGKPVALRQMLDSSEPLMLNFIYTSCTSVCPVMSGIFSQVQAKLGSSVHLVSISIDPEYDTPARLKAYGHRFDAGAQWTMLTGSLQDSIAVQRAFAAYRGDKMEHTATTFMRVAPGQSWVRIDGLASADDLVREFRQATGR